MYLTEAILGAINVNSNSDKKKFDTSYINKTRWIGNTYGTGTQGNNGDRLFIGEGGVDGNGDSNNITVSGGQYFADKLGM